MMDTFKASEVFQIATRIEENGTQFYRHAMTVTGDAKIKDLFSFLADEEVKHKKTFEGMLAGIEDYQPPESYPGEYFAYLRAYAEGLVFSAEKMQAELASITDVESAIEFALQREIESILYYIEARGFVPENQKPEVDRIVDEERRHYLKLVEVKKNLN
jgi:rubrerythrin